MLLVQLLGYSIKMHLSDSGYLIHHVETPDLLTFSAVFDDNGVSYKRFGFQKGHIQTFSTNTEI